MASNITFEIAHSLPQGPEVVTTPGPDRRTLGDLVAALYRALSNPAPMSARAQAFHHSFRALPVPR